jgi:hypothetical protein
MRIAYIARWDSHAESGVLKKMAEQLRTWSRSGADVRLFLLSPSDRVWRGLDGIPVELVRSEGGFSAAMGYRILLRRVEEWKPDVAYVRYAVHYFPLERFLERVPTVLELNTDDLMEYRLYMPAYKFLYHRLTRTRLLRRARGLVSVTNEIAASFAPLGLPTRVIANGIELGRIDPAEFSPSDRMRAVFIGSASAAWHGIDKILHLARRLPDWQFNLIGPERVDGAPQNVVLHGFLGEVEYRSLLATTDIALGTLALHRKRMDEACPLKVREYLALGLPCVIGYRDTDFPSPAPFILQLPNTPENVDGAVDAIRAFGETWRGRRVPRAAVEHLDSVRKEEARLRFLEEVAPRGSRLRRPTGEGGARSA